MDQGIIAIATGVEDYRTVIRQAVKDMGSSGMRVQYANGYTKRLDSAIRQNILDGVSYIARETANANGEAFGADGVELSAHGPCAPDHVAYQGRQYSNKEFQALQERLRRPIGQWGCRHDAYPILLGISQPANSEAELEEMERYSGEKVEIDGKEYSRYECTQLQRKLETSLRYAREEKEIYQAYGDGDLIRGATEKIRLLSNKYVDVSEKAGLATKAERTRIVSSKLKGKQVVSSRKDDIIKSREITLKEIRAQVWNKSLRTEDAENLNSIFSKATDGELAFWKSYGGLVKGSFYDRSASGYYSLREKAVHLQLDRLDERNHRIGEKVNCRLFFHEVGHLFDHNVLLDRNIIDDLPELKNKAITDYVNYANKILEEKGLKKIKTLTRLREEQKNALIEDLIEDGHLKNAVSDLVEGFSNKKIGGMYGHGKEYWKREFAWEKEAIAHMFEAKMQKGEGLDILKLYFPEAYQYFEEFIKGLEV